MKDNIAIKIVPGAVGVLGLLALFNTHASVYSRAVISLAFVLGIAYMILERLVSRTIVMSDEPEEGKAPEVRWRDERERRNVLLKIEKELRDEMNRLADDIQYSKIVFGEGRTGGESVRRSLNSRWLNVLRLVSCGNFHQAWLQQELYNDPETLIRVLGVPEGTKVDEDGQLDMSEVAQ